MASLSATLAGPLSAAETTRYDWLTNGAVSGSLVVTQSEKQRREATFEYHDRGRGPRISERLTLDQSGNLKSLDITGHSYMGAPVDEHFRHDESGARWWSTLEKGHEPDPGKAFYLAADATFEHLAMLVRRALQTPRHTLSLLPAGQASVRLLDQTSISHAGMQRRVRLYEISGLDLSPVYIWLDDDLQLFAVASGSVGLTPHGWAGVLPQLQSFVDAAETAWHKRLAVDLTQTLEGRYAVTNVDVLDIDRCVLLHGRSVVVEHGWIRAVSAGPPSEPVDKLIDGGQGVLMPGLWDMHTHLDTGSGLLHIAAGVTTVRDLGNVPDRLDKIRAHFDDGSVIGPHSFAAGVIDRMGPFAAPIDRLVDSREEALQLVRDYAARGYPQIKIYSSVDPAWVRDISTETHRLGMRLSGHIPSFMTAGEAVRQGFDEIQHINMLFLNFLAGPNDDTRTPLRFSLVAEKAGELDLDSPPVRAFIRLLRDHEVVVDATVAVFDNMFRHRSGEPSPGFAGVAGHMPPLVRRRMLAGSLDINTDNAGRYATSARALLDMVRRLHAAGIRLVAGTDSLAGFGLHRELELYAQAEIPTCDVLRLASLGSAEVMGAATESGSIEAGKRADMVLLQSNPVTDISAIRNTRMVFKGNRAWVPSRLYKAVGIEPFPENPRPVTH